MRSSTSIFSVSFSSRDSVEDNVRRIRCIADVLTDDCAVESIRVTGDGDLQGPSRFEAKSEQRKSEESEWVWKWKGAVRTMSYHMPPTRASSLLWRQVVKSFADMPKPRRLCRVQRIIGTRNSVRGRRSVVEYEVARKSHKEPAWEPEWHLMPRWREAVQEFHMRHNKMLQRAQVLDQAVTKKGNLKETRRTSKIRDNSTTSGGSALREAPSDQLDASLISDDMEYDAAFAKAMSKLAPTR